jgi:hypothetical protein
VVTDVIGHLFNVASGQGRFCWGNPGATGGHFTGLKHQFRVTYGVNRYPSNFTPPAVAKFPAYPYVA